MLLLRAMGLCTVSAQRSVAAVLLGQTGSARSSWGSLRQYYAQVASNTGVSPTVCTRLLPERGNVTPNAISPSIEINRNSLPSFSFKEIPHNHIDTFTSYPSNSSSANITKRSVHTPTPVFTIRSNSTPLLSYSQHKRSLHSARPRSSTHAHVIRHDSNPDIEINSQILIRAQGDTFRDLIIRNWPVQTTSMSAPTQQGSQLGAPPSKFSLGSVKTSLDTLVRGSKPEALHFEKEETAKSESELRSRSGIMSPTITINEKEEEFIGSVDQGTTSSRFIIFNAQGEPVASHQLEFNNIYPQSG